ncbi:hypothetical protein TNIN_138381 [Trichonephila inaurata madagascariensis]|uniref:Uncharacterized protein n=1 Tax=Trichonephila inaurata madagascariensis TaxID=2747483 RepID=A0A8X6KMP7_9ARAC|nr:hypothetical protein TNIN_138381 [Trichonephila inaurata madagascariensis]
MNKSPLEGPSLDRKEFFAFSRSSWYKSLPRSLSPDERCTRALMAQFQSPMWIHTGCHMRYDSWCEPRLRAAKETHTSSEIPEMSNKTNVNEVSKALLNPKEQEVELQAVKNHCEELQDFNTELKENIYRMLEQTKENIRQYKKCLKPTIDHLKPCSGVN